jgi:4-carboxymuconolactone decarboxylase
VADAQEMFRQVTTMGPLTVTTPFERATLDFAIGELWSRPGLARRDRRWLTVTSVCASGNPMAMTAHIYGAMASGDITVQELQEFAIHFALYLGWPKAVAVDLTIKQQWARVGVAEGEPPNPLPTLADAAPAADPSARLARGETAYAEILHTSAPADDAPFKTAGLIGFVFGDAWGRAAVSVRDRRLISLACATDAAIPSAIKTHLKGAFRSDDFSFDEMQEAALHLAVYQGFAKGELFNAVLNEVWDEIEADQSPGGA